MTKRQGIVLGSVTGTFVFGKKNFARNGQVVTKVVSHDSNGRTIYPRGFRPLVAKAYDAVTVTYYESLAGKEYGLAVHPNPESLSADEYTPPKPKEPEQPGAHCEWLLFTLVQNKDGVGTTPMARSRKFPGKAVFPMQHCEVLVGDWGWYQLVETRSKKAFNAMLLGREDTVGGTKPPGVRSAPPQHAKASAVAPRKVDPLDFALGFTASAPKVPAAAPPSPPLPRVAPPAQSSAAQAFSSKVAAESSQTSDEPVLDGNIHGLPMEELNETSKTPDGDPIVDGKVYGLSVNQWARTGRATKQFLREEAGGTPVAAPASVDVAAVEVTPPSTPSQQEAVTEVAPATDVAPSNGAASTGSPTKTREEKKKEKLRKREQRRQERRDRNKREAE